MDECTNGANSCHSLASCTNTNGSYTCSCNQPYAGDGKTCKLASGEWTGRFSWLYIPLPLSYGGVLPFSFQLVFMQRYCIRTTAKKRLNDTQLNNLQFPWVMTLYGKKSPSRGATVVKNPHVLHGRASITWRVQSHFCCKFPLSLAAKFQSCQHCFSAQSPLIFWHFGAQNSYYIC